MPVRHAARLLLAAVALFAGLCTPAHAAVTCDRYASPYGSDYADGSQAFPFKTAQHLSDSLAPGQTGCLATGVYTDVLDQPYVLRANHGGAAGAPITIRSAPGQRATLRGIVYVPQGSDYYTVSDVNIDARKTTPDKTVGIQIMAAHTTIQDSDITTQGNSICAVLGSPGWGQAVDTTIQRNVFHDCGGTSNFLEHSLYVEWTEGGLVTDNLFLRSGAYAIHFYPMAHGTQVTHNVMVDNGAGVIFAGEQGASSNDNVLSQNVIAGSNRRAAVYSWWDGTVGTGNVARDNCLYNPAVTNVDISDGGYSSIHNVIAQPGFADPAHGDYRLASTSPCLSIVGYDTAAKLAGQTVTAPAPAPTPTATATASATATPTAAPTRTPAPTSAPTTTPTPAATPTPRPTSTPAPPAQTPTPTPSPAPADPPVDGPGQQPEPDPDHEPVEAAVVYVDDSAFSASGGSSSGPPPKCRSAKTARARALCARR